MKVFFELLNITSGCRVGHYIVVFITPFPSRWRVGHYIVVFITPFPGDPLLEDALHNY